MISECFLGEKMLGSLCSVLLLIAGAVRGLQWSDQLKEEGPIQICSGQNLQLFWNFTLDKDERLKGMVWWCHPEGKEENVLATYVDDHFVPTSSFSGRLAHLQDGGIELSCATILESGNYSIAVSTEDKNNQLTVHRKTVMVTVVDTPKSQTGEIHVIRKEAAVRDVTTGKWHVQLSCGNFSDRGHPPIDVIWRTPRGDQLDSTDFQEGFFQLLLPNPLVGGNYSCSLPPTQAAARCLAGHSPLLDTVSVEVEENTGRFLLLEAQQQELLEELQADRDTWRRAMEDVANRKDELENRTGELENWRDDALRTSKPVSFHARLTHNTELSGGTRLKLSNVINNQGEGYDPKTGQFRAPLNGTYFFIATTGSYSSGNYANMRLMKEGSNMAETSLLKNSYYQSMGSCHATVSLSAGEKVWLESSTSSYFSSTVTSFSGFRIA